MAQLGAPWLGNSRLNVIPMQVNELDKTTIFSIFPMDVKEYKITVFPGFFHIPAGTPEAPSNLVIGSSSWWKEITESNQILEIPQHSILMAESIVTDWASGMLGYERGNAQPGIFFIPGNLTVTEARKLHAERFKRAEEMQRRWYLNLVNLADVMWSRSSMNPMAISEHMRLAARELKLDDKDWLANYQAVALVKCIACGSPRNPAYPICPTCKAVADPEKAKTLNLKFAE
jgi:hypothetical protein